ncbi:glycosyltransferase involved in cell wall biosynthesis [Salana multivorans]|uniref:Glycosyltransferase involved in cell wall biosynthesis n=1 Tax=Salana multivorans TaxID=120377 RepID=A0A3N2DAW6_9MICO|nr:glycosyltransferase family 2 protein [Salana multivorans]ROR96867.1 glycosyltransferase involved in cell wall biosynthesis [Salana multivorans]
MSTLLSIVVPCYQAAGYMRRSLDSLLPGGRAPRGVEILVVDDGSRDETGEIADAYAARFPGVVRALHQENKGHGGAINTGLAAARGRYVKIVDADDWLDVDAYLSLLTALADLDSDVCEVDLVVTNFVYEKVDRRRPVAVRYGDVLPEGRVFGWDEVGRFRKRQYMLMHSLVYRRELLLQTGLVLPEHTFYVDNLYAYLPLRSVRSMYYLDVDLYRYYIGRPGQSVNEAVMLARVDQQLAVNRAMLPALDAARKDPHAPKAMRRYLLHYFEIVSAVSSILLIRAGSEAALAKKEAFWRELREEDEWLYRRLRRSVIGQITNLPGRPGRRVSVLAYKAAQWAVGFN